MGFLSLMLLARAQDELFMSLRSLCETSGEEGEGTKSILDASL